MVLLVLPRLDGSVIPSSFRFPDGDTAGQVVTVALLPSAFAGAGIRLKEFEAMVGSIGSNSRGGDCSSTAN